jgi:CBS-domain-containing membrane protein
VIEEERQAEARSRPFSAYLAQSTLAGIALAVILVLQDALANVAILTAIAASTFLVFVNPSGIMSQPRRLVGGHITGALVALPFSVVLYDAGLGLAGTAVLYEATAGAAVGFGILVMSLIDTEHGPAAGTILGLVLEPWSASAALLVVGSAFVLLAAKYLLRERLVDLI